MGISSKANEILNAGVKQPTLEVFNPSSEKKFKITAEYNKFPIYIGYAVPNKEKFVKEPVLIYDTEAFKAVIEGPLSTGGIISNTPQSLTINFLCPSMKATVSDVELTLNFQGNDVISFYFQKECHTVNISEFSLLETFYWILLFLVFICAGVVFYYYYIKRNELTVAEMVSNGKEKFEHLYDRIKKSIPINSHKKEESLRLNDVKNDSNYSNLYDESEIMDIKIKTENKNLDEGKKDNFNAFTTDYGGI